MRYIGIITLLVLCLTLLLFIGRMINTVKPESDSGNLENQEDINQSSNNSQSSSTGLVEEPIEEDTEATGIVYPQQWATGDGTVENPWANDCIQKAYDAVPAGGTIFLKAGYYTLSAKLGIYNKAVSIIGEGMNKTIIKTANAQHGFEITQDNCTFKGFTIRGVSSGSYNPFVVANCDYVVFEDIEIDGGYYGMNIVQVNHCSFKNIYAHNCLRHGLHPGSNVAGRNKYNTYQDIYCWDNVSCGFGDIGVEFAAEQTYNTYDNIQCWNNGLHGITLGFSIGVVLSNCSASGNGARGISMYYLEDCTINNCFVTLNTQKGIKIENSKNVNFTNVIVKNNYTGIVITKCSDIILTSCQSYDDRETPLQAYGIELNGANTNISLINCKLTPNKEGEIYNPAGAVLTVITEKREFLLLSL